MITDVIRSFICALFVIFLCVASTICGCKAEDNFDETKIMFTVCIDGALSLSVTNGVECYYHPLEIDGKLVDCK